MGGALLRILVGSYVGLLAIMAGCQRAYIYYPSRLALAQAIARASASGLDPWRDERGELIGWRAGAVGEPSAARVLIFHGNAGSASDRAYFANVFAQEPLGRPWQVYIMEYPGYGAREGRPSERAFVEAGRVALDILWRERSEPVLLIGESLGAGVACALAAERSEAVLGLVLLTPFTSLVDAAAVHYPYLPVRWLLLDRYDNLAALQRYRGHVVVVVAARDRVVPARLGRALYAHYPGPKRLVEQTDADHNTLDLSPQAGWWAEALGFILETASPSWGPASEELSSIRE